jgi:hypothetical protein
VTSEFYLALSPWLIFAVSDRDHGLNAAISAFIAAGLSLAILAKDLRAGHLRSLPMFGAGLFILLGTASLASGDSTTGVYDRSIVTGALAAFLLASLLWDPATAPYAPTSPRHPLSNRGDRHNLVLTLRWAVLASGVAASYAVGALIRDPVTTTICNWFVPIILIVATVSRLPASHQAIDEEVSSVIGVLDCVTTQADDEMKSDADRPLSGRLHVVRRSGADSVETSVSKTS